MAVHTVASRTPPHRGALPSLPALGPPAGDIRTRKLQSRHVLQLTRSFSPGTLHSNTENTVCTRPSDRVQNTACCTRRSRLVTYSIRYSVLYSIMYSILHSIMYSIMHRIQYSMLAGISQMEGCLSVQPNPQCGLLRRRLAGNTPAKYHTVHVIFHKLHDLSPTA